MIIKFQYDHQNPIWPPTCHVIEKILIFIYISTLINEVKDDHNELMIYNEICDILTIDL